MQARYFGSRIARVPPLAPRMRNFLLGPLEGSIWRAITGKPRNRCAASLHAAQHDPNSGASARMRAQQEKQPSIGQAEGRQGCLHNTTMDRTAYAGDQGMGTGPRTERACDRARHRVREPFSCARSLRLAPWRDVVLDSGLSCMHVSAAWARQALISYGRNCLCEKFTHTGYSSARQLRLVWHVKSPWSCQPARNKMANLR